MILYTQSCVWDHPWDPKNINIVRDGYYLKDPFQTKSTNFRTLAAVKVSGSKKRFSTKNK
jgi:hypothetical protein